MSHRFLSHRFSLRALAPLLVAPMVAGCLIIESDTHEHAGPAPMAAAIQTGLARGPVGENTQALIVNNAGNQIGTASFTEGPRGVLIQIDLQPGSISPGWHGLHFHAVGSCHDHGAGFMASTGHLGRGEGITHGFLSPNGPEAGDLPNLYAPPSGPIRVELFSSFVTLAPEPVGDRLPLLDADGAALVIHADPDDYLTQPVGLAGARVACGVLARG